MFELENEKLCDREVVVMQVIRTTLLRRGDGKETPLRPITQYWSMQGDLLAEIDPHDERVLNQPNFKDPVVFPFPPSDKHE